MGSSHNVMAWGRFANRSHARKRRPKAPVAAGLVGVPGQAGRRVTSPAVMVIRWPSSRRSTRLPSSSISTAVPETGPAAEVTVTPAPQVFNEVSPLGYRRDAPTGLQVQGIELEKQLAEQPFPGDLFSRRPR